ncbi:MAG: 2-amino-4-hydroxy-6-hydroxymethyldihydropteridine diphosphokinase [bacterium]
MELRGAEFALSYIGIGSNQGDRLANLSEAIYILSGIREIQVANVSSAWRSDPVGMPPGTREFLNAVIALKTVLSPRDLLSTCLGTERLMGRDRSWVISDRPIDLDLLYFDGLEIREPDLIVPHPRAHTRTFVLNPWIEIAPGFTLYGATLEEWLSMIPEPERVDCACAGPIPDYDKLNR